MIIRVTREEEEKENREQETGIFRQVKKEKEVVYIVLEVTVISRRTRMLLCFLGSKNRRMLIIRERRLGSMQGL